MDKKPKAIVFIDYSNLYYGIQCLGWEIDFIKLKEYFKYSYEVIDIYYYVSEHSFKSYFDTHKNLDRTKLEDIWKFSDDRKSKRKVFSSLRAKGYRLRVKQISSVYDHTEGKHRLKCNADVELTIDAIDRAPNYDVFILISGDADFVRLLQYLKERGKKTVVLGVREHFSSSLRKVANSTFNINGLRKELEYIKKGVAINTKGDH